MLSQRIAVSMLNFHFDPLGLWSPLFIHLKLIYSKKGIECYHWNSPVTEDNLCFQALQKLYILHHLRHLTALLQPGTYNVVLGASI